jgi:hypothetical protein
VTNELVNVTNVVSREISGLDVVNSVNGFYSGAFDKLFGLVLALIALFGVIIPILVQIYQRRVMKVSESELKAEIKNLLEEKKKELMAEIENKLKSEKENIAESLKANTAIIERKLNNTTGGVYHVQGNGNLKEGRFANAAEDFCRAGLLYCKSKSGSDLGAVIKNLALHSLPKVGKKDFEVHNLEGQVNRLIEQAKLVDTENFLAIDLRVLQDASKQAKEREEVKK